MQYQVDKNRSITLLDNQFQVDNIKTGTQRLIGYEEIKTINLRYFSRGRSRNLLSVGSYTCTIFFYNQEKITIQNLSIDYWTGVKRNAAYIKLVKLLHEKTAHLLVDFYTGRKNLKKQLLISCLSWICFVIFLYYFNVVVGGIATVFMLSNTWKIFRYEYPFSYLPTDIPIRFLPLP